MFPTLTALPFPTQLTLTILLSPIDGVPVLPGSAAI